MLVYDSGCGAISTMVDRADSRVGGGIRGSGEILKSVDGKNQLLRKGNHLLKSIHIERRNLWKSKYKLAKKTAQKGVSGKDWCCCEFEVLLETHISLYKVIFIEVLKLLAFPKN
ncbi:unnamed protein product [Lactuca virosa]|uniref:Uncharacterized protein n=1 Tax=Lactuca virosa TaxID=75947 RepID=A0AAU9MUB1_9ASTR|nr:unnamed protein product [Lactuca virosa]